MYIVAITGREDGYHHNQTWDDARNIPDGFVVVTNDLLDDCVAAKMYMDLTIVDGVLTGITAREKPAETEDTTTQTALTNEELTATVASLQSTVDALLVSTLEG